MTWQSSSTQAQFDTNKKKKHGDKNDQQVNKYMLWKDIHKQNQQK